MLTAGIGWVSKHRCGSLRREWQDEFRDAKSLSEFLLKEKVFDVPLKKARWFTSSSQLLCLASGLALRDAFQTRAEIKKYSDDMGMISLNREGALEANIRFYQDYIRSGRKSARGHLFVQTLPTSPLAEAAITFGFKGPLFHLCAAEPQLSLLLARAEALGRRNERLGLLCTLGNAVEAISFLLLPGDEPQKTGLTSVQELKTRAGHLFALADILEALRGVWVS